MEYMTKEQAKKQIIEIGRRMYDKGYVVANDGNISCRIGENEILATPTLVSKGFMTAEMLAVVDLDGTILEQGAYRPSSEIKMHLRVYKENPEVLAVTHAHPPVATSFAVAGIALDHALTAESVVNLGPVPVAHYANPGSTEVPDSIVPYCKTCNAVLLANHGVLTWGKTLEESYFRLESVEYYAKITMNTEYILNHANILNDRQIDQLFATKEKLGIHTGQRPVSREDFVDQTGSPLFQP